MKQQTKKLALTNNERLLHRSISLIIGPLFAFILWLLRTPVQFVTWIELLIVSLAVFAALNIAYEAWLKKKYHVRTAELRATLNRLGGRYAFHLYIASWIVLFGILSLNDMPLAQYLAVDSSGTEVILFGVYWGVVMTAITWWFSKRYVKGKYRKEEVFK